VGPIYRGRSLRQGDPLSPYLFILCVEGMSALIKQAERNNILHGVKVCKRAPTISHLLFTDDSYLFIKANEKETQALKDILDTYASASGQLINMQKSEIYFSRNVPATKKNTLSNMLRVLECIGTGKYLGLPSMIGRSKKFIFNYIKDRIWNRISGWSSKMLSQAGKKVLIKSVAQAIPSDCMSVFLLPHSITEDIEKMLNSFWWGMKNEGRGGFRWLSWERIIMRKEWGEMGFCYIHGFNLAMLGKKGWNFLTNPNVMVSRIFKAKYFSNGNCLGASLRHNPSYVWHSIWSFRILLKIGYQWRIGDGSSIPIWHSPWLQNEANPIISTPTIQPAATATISHLIHPQTRSWNEQLIRNNFILRDVDENFKIPLLHCEQNDAIIWRFDKKGVSSVKSAYSVCVDVLMC